MGWPAPVGLGETGAAVVEVGADVGAAVGDGGIAGARVGAGGIVRATVGAGGIVGEMVGAGAHAADIATSANAINVTKALFILPPCVSYASLYIAKTKAGLLLSRTGK